MIEVVGCFVNPGPCLNGAADTIISLFPFGLYGLVFFGGMIVGERIGIFGILITVAGWLAVRFGTKSPDVHEHVAGPDAAPPLAKKKRRKTIFGGLRK